MSDYQSPVDEPPGRDGHQGQANPDEVFPVPVYEPGTNPVGTHPPVPSENDPATTPPAGSIPGGGAPGSPPSGPPTNVDLPAVTGTPAVGQTLTCTMGNWTNEPVSYDYEWMAGGVSVSTAGDTYVVALSDAGMDITCTVTATNAIGSAQATSVAVTVP